MTTMLFVWMVVATDRSYNHMNWVNLGTFDTPSACVIAASNLGIKSDKYRCILKSTGTVVKN